MATKATIVCSRYDEETRFFDALSKAVSWAEETERSRGHDVKDLKRLFVSENPGVFLQWGTNDHYITFENTEYL